MDPPSTSSSVPISSDRLVWLLCTADSTDPNGTTTSWNGGSSSSSGSSSSTTWSTITSYLWGNPNPNNNNTPLSPSPSHLSRSSETAVAPVTPSVSTPTTTTTYPTDEIRRLYQRFSTQIQRLSPPLKAILIVQLASRAVKSGAPIHRIMETNSSTNSTATSINALNNPLSLSSSSAATISSVPVGSRSSSSSIINIPSPSPKMINVSTNPTASASFNPSSSLLGIHTDVGVIANILLSTYSTDLSELKRFIDCPYPYTLSQANEYELPQNVNNHNGSTVFSPDEIKTRDHINHFPSIQSLPVPTEYIDLVTVFSLLPPSLRAHVAHHIRTEAVKAIQYWSSIATKNVGNSTVIRLPVKIYSDFDDTVQARLFDRSFPYSTTYPGYLELIKGLRGDYDQHSINTLPVNPDQNTKANVTMETVLPIETEKSTSSSSSSITANDTVVPTEDHHPTVLSPLGDSVGIGMKVHDSITSFDGDEIRPSVITDSIIENTNDNAVHAVLAEVAGLVGTELTPLPSSSIVPSVYDSVNPPVMQTKEQPETKEIDTQDSTPSLSLADLSNPTLVQDSYPGTMNNSSAPTTTTPSRSGSPSSSQAKLPSPDKQLSTVVLRSNTIVGVRKTRVTVYSDLALGAWALENNNNSLSSSTIAVGSTNTGGGNITPHGLATPPALSGLGSVQRKPLDRSALSNSTGTTPMNTPPRNLRNVLDESNSTNEEGLLSSSMVRNYSIRSHEYSKGKVGTRADLIFLSARPGFLRSQTLTLASSIGLDHAAILCGTITAALNHSLMAARKLANHMLHSSLFPEFRTLFIGDSGQADIEFSLQMLIAHRQLKAGILMREPDSPLVTVPPPVALIHDICSTNQTPLTAQAQRARLRAKQIHMFDSYIDAASLCYCEGLLTPQALLRIVDHTTTALARINFGTGSERQRISRLQEYQLAVRRVQYILNQDGYSHFLSNITEHNNGVSHSNNTIVADGDELSSSSLSSNSVPSESFSRIKQVTNTIITKHHDDSDDEKESKHVITTHAALGPGGFGYM